MTYAQVVSQVHKLTFEMLGYAQSADWEKLLEVEQQRAEWLEKMRLCRPENDSENEIGKKLAETIEANYLIETLGNIEKNNCLNNLKQSKISKKAAQEYARY